MKQYLSDLWYLIYKRGIRRLIPKYYGRTIFTAFYWRTLRDRIKKGYDESELWSLDYSLTKLIAPRIRDFAEDFKATKFSLPSFLLEEEREEAVKKGFAWNSQWHRLENKKEDNRCFERAAKRWYSILDEIARGFEDMLLEADDWNAWTKKWEPAVKLWSKKLNKAKTPLQKQDVWRKIGSWRDYRVGIVVSAEDITYSLHERAKSLLFHYYNHLWS